MTFFFILLFSSLYFLNDQRRIMRIVYTSSAYFGGEVNELLIYENEERATAILTTEGLKVKKGKLLKHNDH